MRGKRQRGSALLEFSLAGVMFMWIWIQVVEMSIGMWQYHTMQAAVKVAGDYAAVHGAGCAKNGNTCSIQVKDVANVLKNYAVGVDSTNMTVTFNVMASDHVTPVSGQTITCQLSGGGSSCVNNATTWPPASYNTPGTDFEIKSQYQFRSTLGSYWLPSLTHQMIVF